MKAIVLGLITSVLALHAHAKTMTPMGIIEKTSYQISGLVNKGKIDKSYQTDVTLVTVQKTPQGFEVQASSPSADLQSPNLLNLSFDLSGKVVAFSSAFNSVNLQSPVFSSASAAELLDLGAEAFVDHLAESADYLTVAQNTEAVELVKNNAGVLLNVKLADGRIYHLQMDIQGKVLSRGF